MKVNHGISTIKWLLKQKNILKGLDILKTMTNLKGLYYEDKKMLDNMKKYYQTKRKTVVNDYDIRLGYGIKNENRRIINLIIFFF